MRKRLLRHLDCVLHLLQRLVYGCEQNVVQRVLPILPLLLMTLVQTCGDHFHWCVPGVLGLLSVVC